MANKRKVRITLVGPLTLAVGRYRFYKDKPQLTEDQELIKYCEKKLDFRVVDIKEEPKKVPAAPTLSQPEPGKKEPEKTVPESPAPENQRSTENEDSSEKDQTDESKSEGGDQNDSPKLNEDTLDIDNQSGEQESASPAKLTRKP